MKRRIFGLVLGLVLAAGAYAAAWHVAADRLLSEADEILAALGDDGNRALCEAPVARGFPFQIGIDCTSTYLERAALRASFSTGPVTSSVSIFSPFRAVAKAAGPARLTLPGIMPLDIGWQSLRATMAVSWPLPKRILLEAGRVEAVADMPTVDGAAAFKVDRAEVALQTDRGDVLLSGRFDGFTAGKFLLAEGVLPSLSGAVRMTVPEGVARLTKPRDGVRGLAVDVLEADIRTATGAAITAKGSVSVGADGLISAQLMLGAAKPAELADVLTKAFPAQAAAINSAFASIAALGDNPSLPLTIDKGQAYLGFVPLGSIPPL